MGEVRKGAGRERGGCGDAGCGKRGGGVREWVDGVWALGRGRGRVSV